MRTKTFFGLLFACLFISSAAFAQAPVVIYDPLRAAPEKNFTDADEQLVKTKVLPKISTKWNDDSSCEGSNLSVIGAVDGSFTKKATANQRKIRAATKIRSGRYTERVGILCKSKYLGVNHSS